jgi:predicted DNA-binding protein (MmcQ/YjbR family)
VGVAGNRREAEAVSNNTNIAIRVYMERKQEVSVIVTGGRVSSEQLYYAVIAASELVKQRVDAEKQKP